MAVNSRNKGKRGELEAAKKIAALFGVAARRGQQFSGGAESPDIVTGLKGVHFEVKFVEKLNLRDAMEQSKRDAASDEIPVVMHRTSRKPWLITVVADDLPRLVKILTQYIDDG